MIKEIELKYRLHDAASLERLKNTALAKNIRAQTTTKAQTNYFFDTPDYALKSNRVTLRLRREDHEYTLCVKGDDPNNPRTSDSISIRLEYEKMIDETNAQKMLALSLSPLEFLALPQNGDPPNQNETRHFLHAQMQKLAQNRSLILVGSFSNLRICVPVTLADTQLTLELDETRFGAHIVHHEVELEMPESVDVERVEHDLKSIFDDANVAYFNSNGKAERFYTLLASGQLR
jgi:uncharacterized protein YjbK